MSISFGNIPLGSVLPIPFTSYGKTNGESITLTGLAVTDVEVYKGVSMTQRASDVGYVLLDTDGIDIDGITGFHGFSVDTGDNTDAGFFVAGSFYTVLVSAVTIDAQTVNFIAATFRLTAVEADVSAIKTKTDFLPSATAGAAGGVFIAGTNAPVTIASSIGEALTLTSTGGNGAGLAINGNGTQAGLRIEGGAGGSGLSILGGATSGKGVSISATDGDGVTITANGSSKHGLLVTGGTAGVSDGIKAVAGTGGVDIRGAITGNITGNLSGSVGSATIVNGLAANVITAAAAAADFTTEIQAGLATAAALATAQTSIDDVPTNAELATALGTADDAVLVQVALVKAKTDLIPAAPAAVGDVPTAIANADALLNRDMATGTDSGSTTVRTPRQALRFLRNKWDVTTGTLTVKKEDDSTTSWTAVVTGTAGADPITTVDPAGP